LDKLYFALVDTPGLFAAVIRKVIKQNYIHVAIAMDENLENTYTVGRRHPFIPWFAGFTRERSEQILLKFPNARYRIIAIECEKEQKENIRRELEYCYKQRFQYHYNIIGLPFILLNRPFYQKNHYTCSSFIAKLMYMHGMELFDKHFSLVTPRDFNELPDVQVLYEGRLADYVGCDYQGEGELVEA